VPQVSVDPDRCQGHARCWDICPEVLDLGDKVRDAVRNCPERAISLT
jgi:ferredoxin